MQFKPLSVFYFVCFVYLLTYFLVTDSWANIPKHFIFLVVISNLIDYITSSSWLLYLFDFKIEKLLPCLFNGLVFCTLLTSYVENLVVCCKIPKHYNKSIWLWELFILEVWNACKRTRLTILVKECNKFKYIKHFYVVIVCLVYFFLVYLYTIRVFV